MKYIPTQKSITINGKRYRSVVAIKKAFPERNKAGNIYIDDASEMVEHIPWLHYHNCVTGQKKNLLLNQ